jgi:hypothetical protein
MSGQKIYKYPCPRHEGIFGEFLPSEVDRLSGERHPLAVFSRETTQVPNRCQEGSQSQCAHFGLEEK